MHPKGVPTLQKLTIKILLPVLGMKCIPSSKRFSMFLLSLIFIFSFSSYFYTELQLKILLAFLKANKMLAIV